MYMRSGKTFLRNNKVKKNAEVGLPCLHGASVTVTSIWFINVDTASDVDRNATHTGRKKTYGIGNGKCWRGWRFANVPFFALSSLYLLVSHLDSSAQPSKGSFLHTSESIMEIIIYWWQSNHRYNLSNPYSVGAEFRFAISDSFLSFLFWFYAILCEIGHNWRVRR